MKKTLLLLIALSSLGLSQSQTNYNNIQYDTGTSLPGSCSGPAFFINTTTLVSYACVAGHFVSLLQTTGLYLNSLGYVGIGTSVPAAVLDINGQLDLGGVQGLAYTTSDTTVNGTVAVGSGAATTLPATAAYGITAIGYQALGGIANTTAAINNTAIGFQALLANTSGNSSTAVGYQALAQSTTTTNTAVGFKALTTGNSNSSTAVGFNANNAGALTNGTTVGSNSCSVCTGTGDTSLGTNANRFVSSGARNVGIGQNANQGITGTRITGSDNTSVGDSAGLLLQGVAASNSFFGSAVGSTVTTGTNNILIGMSNTCAPSTITTSNETIICGPTGNSLKITGNNTVGTEIATLNGTEVVTTTGSGVTLTVTNSNGSCTLTPITTTWSCSSDARLKKDIRNAAWGLGWARSFRIRDFTLRSNGEAMTGVIAQEVQKTHPEMVHVLPNGTLTVDAPNPWVLLKAIQQLQSAVVGLALLVLASFAFTWYRTRA